MAFASFVASKVFLSISIDTDRHHDCKATNPVRDLYARATAPAPPEALPSGPAVAHVRARPAPCGISHIFRTYPWLARQTVWKDQGQSQRLQPWRLQRHTFSIVFSSLFSLSTTSTTEKSWDFSPALVELSCFAVLMAERKNHFTKSFKEVFDRG
jgi:hypothetical protein